MLQAVLEMDVPRPQLANPCKSDTGNCTAVSGCIPVASLLGYAYGCRSLTNDSINFSSN